MTEQALLEVKDLSVSFRGPAGLIPALREASLRVDRSEALAVVGESGSGKTTLLRAIAGLLAPGAVTSGSVRFDQKELLGAPESSLRELRGSQIGFVFQDPVNCFNPSMSIGAQLRRVLALHRPNLPRDQYDREVLAMLAEVGVDGEGKLGNHPFEFSQGQLQRMMIAAACLGGHPRLLLADEPTTSLDVTTEAQVLELLRNLRREREMALVLVTHNLAVAAQLCDRVAVMYAGRVVEESPTEDLFVRPAHPYTRQLLKALPRFPHRGGRLEPIPGESASAPQTEVGCSFAPRCGELLGDICLQSVPPLVEATASQKAACHLYSGTERANESPLRARAFEGEGA